MKGKRETEREGEGGQTKSDEDGMSTLKPARENEREKDRERGSKV